jgi:PAS domain S-box-containing protein
MTENRHAFWLPLLAGVALVVAVNLFTGVPQRIAAGKHAHRLDAHLDSVRRSLGELELLETLKSDDPVAAGSITAFTAEAGIVGRQIDRYRKQVGDSPALQQNAKQLSMSFSRWVAQEISERAELTRPTPDELLDDRNRLLQLFGLIDEAVSVNNRQLRAGHAAQELLQWSVLGVLAYLFVLIVFLQARRRHELGSAYQALETAHDQLREAQRIAHLGFWELDMVSGELNWSEEIYRMFAIKPGGFRPSYQAFIDRIHPEDRAAVDAAFSRAVDNRAPYDIVHRLLLDDGSVRYVQERGEIFYDDEDRAIRSLGTVQDISERVAAEEDLEQAAFEWNHTLDYFQDAVYLLDLQGHIMRANRAFYDALGLTPQQVLGRDIMDLMYPDGPPESCPVLDARRAGRDARVVLEAGHPSNIIDSPSEVTLRFVRDNSGKPLSILTAVRDLRPQREVEDELRKHRDHLEELVAQRTRALKVQAQIIDQIHDSVVSTDLDGIVTSWNRGAERLFGYSAHEATGKPIGLLYPAGEQAFVEMSVIAPLKDKGEHEVELRMRRKDGSELDANLSLSMLYDANGVAEGMIGYALDISDRKRAEAELRKRSDALAAINEELEAFSYSVSHDLRAPLRAIDGFSQLLLDDYGERLDGQGRDYLTRVRAGAQRMAELIDDLLELSRVGRHELKRQRIDLSVLAGELVGNLRDGASRRNAEFVIAPGMQVDGDRRLIGVALDNLLANAWKYTARAEHARIEFGSYPDKGNTVFYVRDNGIGFDMRYADKLFGAFQRLHGKEFEGSGVGLATVQRIIHRHGGRIWAESELGKGAAFFFTLP